MAEITNPEAVRYANEVVRPLAESVRALKAQIDAATVAWFGGINAHYSEGADTLEDGRESEGVSRLTGGDVTDLLTQLIALQTALDAGGVADVISKPCVRPISVQ